MAGADEPISDSEKVRINFNSNCEIGHFVILWICDFVFGGAFTFYIHHSAPHLFFKQKKPHPQSVWQVFISILEPSVASVAPLIFEKSGYF